MSGEVRQSGVRGVLIYCADYKCAFKLAAVTVAEISGRAGFERQRCSASHQVPVVVPFQITTVVECFAQHNQSGESIGAKG
jgi:hypothetical protein